MKRAITLLSLSLMLFGPSHTLHAGRSDAEHLKISALFYPETTAWLATNELRNPSRAHFKEVAPGLRKALIRGGICNEPQKNDCRSLETLFSGAAKRLSSFYILDVNSDAIPDVIYSGIAYGSEGDATIIWIAQKGDYTLLPEAILPVKMLRIDPRTQKFSSVAVGCCDSRVDEYYLGAARNVRRHGIRRNKKWTDFNAAQTKAARFHSESLLILRESPVTDDSYDPNRSDWAGLAIFGNILAKFLPGCSGRIVGERQDENAKRWYLVVIDAPSKSLRTHAPFDVDAGWVDEGHMK